MNCTWFQCTDTAKYEVKNTAYGTVLGHNCEQHVPKSKQAEKDYVVTEIANANT